MYRSLHKHSHLNSGIWIQSQSYEARKPLRFAQLFLKERKKNIISFVCFKVVAWYSVTSRSRRLAFFITVWNCCQSTVAPSPPVPPQKKTTKTTHHGHLEKILNSSIVPDSINIKILNAGAWARSSDRVTVTLPMELEDYIPQVEEFYRMKHNGRKLQWHHLMSNGIVSSFVQS